MSCPDMSEMICLTNRLMTVTLSVRGGGPGAVVKAA